MGWFYSWVRCPIQTKISNKKIVWVYKYSDNVTRRCGCLLRVMHMTCDPPNHPKPSQTPQKRHQCDARKSMGASVDSGACDTTQLHSSVAQWPIRICDECDLVMRGVPYKHHPPCPNRCKPCQGKHFCVKSLQSSGVPNMHVPSIHWLRQLIRFVIWHNLLVLSVNTEGNVVYYASSQGLQERNITY